MESELKVELLAVTPDAQLLIEKCARDCYDSLDKMKLGSKLVQGCVKRGHLSILGHAQATFRVSGVSRSLTHQLVRHRIACFSQRSQRYVKESDFDYVIPEKVKDNASAMLDYEFVMRTIEGAYARLVKKGIPKEDARFVLPNACASVINVSMNFQALLGFFKLRLDKHAQWEIRRMSEEMWNLIRPHAPQVFNQECLESVPKLKIDWENLK